MQAKIINNMTMLFVIFLFLSVSFGCATNRQVQVLEKEIKQLRDIALQAAKEVKVKRQENYKLSAQIAKKVEAAAARAERAASKAESAAVEADSSAEILSIFLYEGKGKIP